MRLSRRGVLALLGLGGAGAAFAAHRYTGRSPGDVSEPTPIAIRAEPLPGFRPGGLVFRSGLAITSPHPAFGGFSGLWRSSDGAMIVAISDGGVWMTAEVVRENGRLQGLAKARLAPVLGADGVPLAWVGHYDMEALAIADGVAYVGIERTHQVMRFPFARDGLLARAEAVPMPDGTRRLAANAGLEAVAVAPPGHPLAGALVAVAERVGDGRDTPTVGFVLDGPRTGEFTVARSEGFDVTDLAFLPSGEALLLERRFSLLDGVAMRIRRLPVDAIAPGARADGPVIVSADRSDPIDNMEGLAVHREGGETILTLISDDNFSRLQRTLLLEFALPDAPAREAAGG